MVQAIRIEHNDGIGIFREKNSNNQIRKHSLYNQNYDLNIEIGRLIYERHNRLPIPYEDNRLRVDLNNKEWFCAYKSIDQIQQWIYKDEFKYLIELGYKIYLLDVTEYQIGNYQVLYTKESILNKKDITELFI